MSDALSARHWLAEQVEVLRATVARRANAPGWPSCATTTAPRPTWKCWTRSATCWAQQKLVQTRRALLSSRVGLYAALGGGTRPPALTETPTPSATPADAAPPAPVRGQ